ncbi:hypothetical protein D0T49_11405 [Paludibacter sp. 221]|uniref:hypothetical protein n=1 Tax=Paludibacter sp. 221 TaxID=2302939 RepID=UPI0013D8DED6|nr:hypothetical protein [Paludibacter sp. 221]NDV47653.1 hypothetical protein [Paludibacter sp. 221]
MHKNKVLLIILIAIISIPVATSQNNTNSPYTRFGFGEISDNTSGEQRAMGGVAIGARSKSRINVVNPASYSMSDSLTFMMDLGVSALASRFSDENSNKKTSFNGNLEYLTLQFRLFKGVGISAGILPYSFAGYNFYTSDSIAMPGFEGDDVEQIKYTTRFNGTGGISQVYLGLSADLFNHFSVGANMYYMFGSYDNIRVLNYNNTSYQSATQTNSITANHLRFRFGVQFYNTFAEKHDVTIGAIYEPKMLLKADAQQTNISHFETVKDLTNSFDLPQMFGAGLYYKYDNKLSVGVDYTLHQWKDALYFGQRDSLANSSKLALGFEYQPNYRSRKYGERIMYRFGVNTNNPYYKLEGENAGLNFGITFGIGLPLPSSSRTMLNMTFEYGKVGAYKSKLNEDYFKFTFNFALAETWFFKRKL